MKEDVAVIGAGTAGLITAKRLAQLEISTTVYDQKKVLGIPVRASGILSIKGLNELGIDYRRAVTNTLYGARIHSGRQIMKVESENPKAHVLDRKKLNDLCHDEAVSAGADVLLEKRISGSEMEALADSKIIVGADGAVSEVAKHFGMGEIKRYAVTYKAEFDINAENPKLVDLFFDKTLSGGLFGWISPNANDILEVGIGLDSRKGNAKTAFERFASSSYVSEILGKAKRISEGASIIPMKLRRNIVDPERKILLVGDAAGQVKPSTGGGIIYGGNAAIMAAETIGEHLDKGMTLRAYEKRYRSKYQLDTTLHSIVNKFYSGISKEGLEFTISALNSLGINSFISKYVDMDMPSLILKNMLYKNSSSQ
jgi:geranylgeranyl reductase family protein